MSGDLGQHLPDVKMFLGELVHQPEQPIRRERRCVVAIELHERFGELARVGELRGELVGLELMLA